MDTPLYHCIIKYFSISDAFAAIDVLFDYEFDSVSCAEDHKDKWIVEIIHATRIDPHVIRSILNLGVEYIIESEALPDTDWLKKSFQNFKPLTIGSFYIYGPHLRDRPIPIEKVGIEIAAATAFGTGNHATTNRCLAAIETYLDPFRHGSFLDVGCGSGVLAIAAAKLGMRNIVACDNNDEAVRVAKENTVINHVEHQVYVFQNEACEFANKSYDFVVANILAAPLIEMKQSLLKALNIDGLLVLSGFTTEDPSVEKAFTTDDTELVHKYNHNGWTTLVYKKVA